MKRLSAILAAVALAISFSIAEAQIEILSDSGSSPEFSSSVSCAKCHRDIFNYWKESLHAHALDDYIFQASFMMAIKEQGDGVRSVCLSCHAPTAVVNGDLKTELPISREAVTCDFCHRISDVNTEGSATRVTLTSGKDKYGPLKPSLPTEAHASVQSDLFTDSKFCASCHQWSNAQGVPIFDTYREWLNGPFAKSGVHCQNCHMPLVEGSIVVGEDKGRTEKINSHNLSGGHSIIQVASAAEIRVVSVERVPGGIQAIVEVLNAGSGHMIPTGIPSRSLVLEAELLDAAGKIVETARHEFRKIVVDRNHNELKTDTEVILNGAAISKDNRIPPGEKVKVSFSFAASPTKEYVVKATLNYRYNPLILREEQVNIEIDSDFMSP